MNTNREKLINWIRNTYVSNPPYTYKATVDDTADAVIADYLIANGVVVREKGEWIGEGDGYADGEIVYDVWYCPECDHCIDDGTDDPALLPNFCPNCGADMRRRENDD